MVTKLILRAKLSSSINFYNIWLFAMKKILPIIVLMILANTQICSFASDLEYDHEENRIENYNELEDPRLELQTGIPREILQKLRELSNNIPFSIRSKKRPNYRFNEPFDSKPSTIHQKTSNRPPVSGHLTELDQLTRIIDAKTTGIDLTDHSFGMLPKHKQHLDEKILNKYHPSAFAGTHSLFQVNGRIFYGKTMARFNIVKEPEIADAIKNISILKIKNPSLELTENRDFCNVIVNYKDKYFIQACKEPFAKKYFIQESECIQSILDNINKAEYTIESFNNGILKFKSRGFLTVSFLADLNKLIDIKSDTSWKFSVINFDKIDIKVSPMRKKIEEIVNFLLEKNQKSSIDMLLHKYALLDVIEENDQETIIRPLMVQAGNSGNPITGDFDLMDVYLPVELPEISFIAMNTYTDNQQDFIEKVKLLRDIFTLTPAEKLTLRKKSKFFAELPEAYINTDYTDPIQNPYYQVFQCLARYTDPQGNKQDPMAKYLQSNWVAMQGKMHLGAYLLNCAMNITIGKKMFNHGTESFNPGSSDDFGVLDHFYKGKIYHTETEKECLDFYFHDEDYLNITFTRVHPYFLRKRTNNSTKDDLSEYWLDLIKIQILNGHVNKIGTLEQIRKDYNKYAPGKGDEIVKFSQEVKRLTLPKRQLKKVQIYKLHGL